MTNTLDDKSIAKIVAALDAADTMYSEFMDASCSIREQMDIYKKAHAKVKAARKVLES